MDIATITKLVRNISMIVVIPFISYLYLKQNIDKKIKNHQFYQCFLYLLLVS